MAIGHRGQQRDVETDCGTDSISDLCNFDRVGQSRSLVILRVDEHLGLSCEATKRRRVENAIAISLEAGPQLVGFLGHGSVTRTVGSSRSAGEKGVFRSFTRFAGEFASRYLRTRTTRVSEDHAVRRCDTPHCAGPRDRLFVRHDWRLERLR
jgi:hypothetical protein